MSKLGNVMAGIANAQVKSTRLPTPALGTADYLLNELRWKFNMKGDGYRVVADLTCLRTVNGEQHKGDHVQHPIFSGDYFDKELKRLLLTLLDVAPDKEDEVLEIMAPADKEPYNKMSPEQRKLAGWDNFIRMSCALDKDDNPTASGSFDGQVVIRLETVQSEPKVIKDEYVKNDKGEFVPKMTPGYINTYPKGIVPLADVADFLKEEEIARYFGSSDKFAELLAAEIGG